MCEPEEIHDVTIDHISSTNRRHKNDIYACKYRLDGIVQASAHLENSQLCNLATQ